MNILITGSSSGIGLEVSQRFLNEGFTVYGIDIKSSNIDNPNYHHFIADVSKMEELPDLSNINYIFQNAGTQNSQNDIDNNLKGTINVIEKYAFTDSIKGVLLNASASASTGFEFPAYVASKAGILGYMKNVAVRLTKYNAICNSISLGGVITESNSIVMDDETLWNKIMDVTPLKKWMTKEEVSDWVYFLLVVNKSASGQDFLVDNGEKDLNSTFVWPNY